MYNFVVEAISMVLKIGSSDMSLHLIIDNSGRHVHIELLLHVIDLFLLGFKLAGFKCSRRT